MKMIIQGDLISEEDMVVIARFFREFWKERKDKLYLWIEEGTADLNSEEVQELFRQVFMVEDSTKNWTLGKITAETIQEFREAIRKKKEVKQ